VHFSWGTLVLRPSTDSAFGVKVTTRLDKRAVVRNHLRRQLLHFCYQSRDRLPCAQILIIPRFIPTTNQFSQIKSDLLSLVSNL
jgi:ribonuclease P protein component